MWSCSNESHTDVLEIKFKSLVFEKYPHPDLGTLIDRSLLTFSFIDGNGNIGDRNRNNTSVVYFTWFRKLPDQSYEPYEFPSIKPGEPGIIEQYNVIPYSDVMNKDGGQNKTLKGTIKVTLFPPVNPQNTDTMRIEYYIVDRTLKKSNVDYTPDFSILNLQDIITK